MAVQPVPPWPEKATATTESLLSALISTLDFCGSNWTLANKSVRGTCGGKLGDACPRSIERAARITDNSE